MKTIFSFLGLVLAFLSVSYAQPASSSKSKHETIKKAVLYQSLIVQQESDYILLSRCTSNIKEIRQLPLNSRNLCVFELPDLPAISYRNDRTSFKVHRHYNYQDAFKVLANFRPVTVYQSIPLLC